MANCPHCNIEIKTGFFATASLLSEGKIDVINEYSTEKRTGGCTKCSENDFDEAKSKLGAELLSVRQQLVDLIEFVPVVSLQSPFKWEYEVLGMVTGQSTTGTGFISEFTSSWTDLFGAQSGRYNSKLRAGEDLCFGQLRTQCLNMGGHAVIGTDIDYSEVGGMKGMLMVCMAGTAVKLSSLDVLGSEQRENIQKLYGLNDRLLELNELSRLI
jgi:uncharacterized protein YbjQ (UPF0145 family)